METADSYNTALCYVEAQRNDGLAEDQLAFNAYDLERFRLGDDPIMYPNINWYKELTNKMAIQTQHNVNISGGTKKFVTLFLWVSFIRMAYSSSWKDWITIITIIIHVIITVLIWMLILPLLLP